MIIENCKNQQKKLQIKSLKKNSQKVGSIQYNRVNYDKDERFFNLSDIPEEKRNRVQIVKDFVNNDILEIKKKEWNGSNKYQKNDQISFGQKLHNIKSGLYETQIANFKEKNIPIGVQTRAYHYGWNSTSTKENSHQSTQRLLKKTIQSLENSEKAQHQAKFYKTLQRRHTERQLEQNFTKRSQDTLRSQIESDYKFDNPSASKQKVKGAVFRLFDQALRQKHDHLNFTYRPQILNIKKEKKIHGKHNGVWQSYQDKDNSFQYNNNDNNYNNQKNVEQNELYYAWSCCMNSQKDSQGCQIQSKSIYKWNLATFQS